MYRGIGGRVVSVADVLNFFIRLFQQGWFANLLMKSPNSLFMQRVVVFTSGKFTRARAASFLEKSSMSRIWSSQVIE
jgi:hypothetical protein